MSATEWSELADVASVLRRRWNTGQWLVSAARGEGWEPVSVPLKGPTSSQLGALFGEAQQWVQRWQVASEKRGLRLEWRAIGGRAIGVNQVPCKVWFESERTALNLLNLRSEVTRFTELVGAERHRAPKLVDWMLANPFRVLDAEDDWNRMVRTVLWIDGFGGPDRYLRQVDVPGVDTKFIETHRGILGRLLDHQLSSDRVDQTSPRNDIAGRYGLKKKPHYVRFRFLSPQPSGFSEMSVHVEELAERPPPVSRVFAVENEITYLAFPEVTDSLLILAGGYAIPTLAPLQWLSSCELRYWGDIDTHGFAILNQLRRAFPATRALLMDRATLLAHEAHWGTESEQTRAVLESLNNDESALYQDLIENSFADGVRLEQERVRFSAIEAALQAIRDSTPQ